MTFVCQCEYRLADRVVPCIRPAMLDSGFCPACTELACINQPEDFCSQTGGRHDGCHCPENYGGSAPHAGWRKEQG